MKTTVENLRTALDLVKGGCANTSSTLVPILHHFCFEPKWVFACDDVVSIAWHDKSFDLSSSAPSLLLELLQGVKGSEEVELTMASATALKVKSKRLNMELPSIGKDSYLAEIKVLGTEKELCAIPLQALYPEGVDVVDVLAQCFAYNPALTLQAGVVLESEKGLRLYTTDNSTVSTYRYAKGKSAPVKVVVPIKFFSELSRIRKLLDIEAGQLFIGEHAVWVWFGARCILFTKTIALESTKQFISVLAKYDDWATIKISSGFRDAVKRASLLLKAEESKFVRIEIGDGVAVLQSEGHASKLNERVPWKDSKAVKAGYSVIVDIEKLQRAVNLYDSIGFNYGDVLQFVGAGKSLQHILRTHEPK